MTGQSFGRDVLGPILAEFCLRLWSLASLVDDRDATVLLFCARGGLRLQFAYERFLISTGLPQPTCASSLMVSRVVAVRPAVLAETSAAKSALRYEFGSRSVCDVAKAISGHGLESAAAARWNIPYGFDALTSLLRHPDGSAVAQVLVEQSSYFLRHLDVALAGRRHAILVDTGLYGTTQQLLSGTGGNTSFSCAMLARSNYREDAAPHFKNSFGLCVEADRYQPWRRRTAILRYWHLIEAAFEPDLPSVRMFTDTSDGPVSNLEANGWRDKIGPESGSLFDGMMSYIDALPPGPANRIVPDAARAWRAFRRAVVWPDTTTAIALDVGYRDHDFGVDEGSAPRPWTGALAALQGHSLWREGEIARSGSVLRLPLLAAIEAGYGARALKRALSAALMASKDH